jgi:CBS domain-containing protein
MQVREIMTENPACCGPDSSIMEAARKMAECDCGEIPVVDRNRQPVGVITDRDIACRAVAAGKDPQGTKVREVMSSPVVTVTPDASIEECCKTMEQNKVRRVPVVDGGGGCCGIISQADIARSAPEHETAEVVKDVSQPSGATSRAGRR